MLKYLHLSCFFILTFPFSLFADIATLDRIAKAEREIGYVGVRLKTTSTSRGALTMTEFVIHKSAESSYKKVLDVVGERKSGKPERTRKQQREGNAENNRRRSRNRRGDESDNESSRRNRNREFHRWRRDRSQFSTKEIELIAKNYHLETRTSDEKIADYETDLLIITPKLPGRPTKYISFARENGIILQVKDLDSEDTLREMFVYTWISFEPETMKHKWEAHEQEIKPEPRRNQSISLDEAESRLKCELVQPDYLPMGFQLQDVQVIKDRKATVYLIYTDGLLGFSLFETTQPPTRWSGEPRKGWRTLELSGTTVYKHERGLTHAFGWASGDIDFFLLSEMPAHEMLKVIESIIHITKKK